LIKRFYYSNLFFFTKFFKKLVLIKEDQVTASTTTRDRTLTRPASSVFRRSLLFRKSGVPAGISKNHQVHTYIWYIYNTFILWM